MWQTMSADCFTNKGAVLTPGIQGIIEQHHVLWMHIVIGNYTMVLYCKMFLFGLALENDGSNYSGKSVDEKGKMGYLSGSFPYKTNSHLLLGICLFWET